MATRVRKLAKQLRRPSAEVLGLLHALGYVRYKTDQDMVGDEIVARLRSELRDGLVPVSLEVREVARPKPGDPAEIDRWAQAPMPLPAPTTPMGEGSGAQAGGLPIAVLQAALEAAIAGAKASESALATEQARANRLAAELAHTQVELVRAQGSLGSSEASEGAVQAAALLPEPEPAAPIEPSELDGASLAQLLHARGLSGDDELERALGAMAGIRVLRDLLPYLTVTDGAAVARLLKHRLVLTGDDATADLGASAAVVRVAAERAELPSADQLRRLLDGVGEQCLLVGIRQVTLSGGPPLWHRLIRTGLDERIVIRVSAASPRTVPSARADIDAGDGTVLIDVPVSDDAVGAYEAAEHWVLRSEASRLSDLLAGWADSLRQL